MRNILLILSCIIIRYNAQCQQVISPMVPYEVGFQFKEGVFLSFNDFKFNNAIPFEDVIDKNGNPIDFKKLMDEESKIGVNLNNNINTTENLDIRVFLPDTMIDCKLDMLWGLSNGTSIFINSRERGLGFILDRQMPDTARHGFFAHVEITRIGKIGSICHFADFDFQNNRRQLLLDGSLTNKSQIAAMIRDDVDEYILIIATGEIYKFNLEGMSLALEHDSELLTSFLNESNKAKRDDLKVVLYKYLALYNRRYPLYFPK